MYSHFLKIVIAVVLVVGLSVVIVAQKKKRETGNIPSPLNPVRPNKKYGPKVEKFLDQSETYWHVFHNNLPEPAYEFLADNPNTLSDAVLLPNQGWFIQGQYGGRYQGLPSDMEKSYKEEGNSLSTLTIAPNGGWVMLSSKKEEGDYVRTPGAKMLRPYNFDNRRTERRGAAWNNIPETLSKEIQRLYDEWIYIDLVRFTAKGEWVVIYHKQGQCGFGFTTSNRIDPQFYKALFNLWSQGVPIRDIAFWGENGYAVIVNEIGYVAENVPDKVLFALEDLRKHGASSWRTTRLASAFDGRWLIFLRESAGAPNATCYENYPIKNRLGYPKSEVPPRELDSNLPTLKRRNPEETIINRGDGEFESDRYKITVPRNWNVMTNLGIAVYSPSGKAKMQDGYIKYSHGVEIGFVPTNGADLNMSTKQFVSDVQSNFPYLRNANRTAEGYISGRKALISKLYGGNPSEIWTIYTTKFSDTQMAYIIQLVPEDEYENHRAIFAEILRSFSFPERNPVSSQIVTSNGYTFELRECLKKGTDLICYFTITSNGRDRYISIAGNYMGWDRASLWDNAGNEYIGSDYMTIGNKTGWATLVGDVPTKASIPFKNISPEANKISLLKLSIRYGLERYDQGSFFIEFRNVPINR